MVLNTQGLRYFWQGQLRVDGSMLSLFVDADGVCFLSLIIKMALTKSTFNVE